MSATRLPNLEDLETLVLIAQCGSIGQAAQRLSMSQPHVSRRMSALERRLEVRILERAPTGTSLTPAGRVLVDWAEILLASAQEFTDSVASLRVQEAEAVPVGVSMTIAEHLAPRWLGTLRKTHPTATISLTVSNSAEVVAAVEASRVVMGFVESPVVPPGLRSRRVATDVLAIAVAPGHPWEHRSAIPVPVLAQTGLLVREPGSGTRETIEHALRGHGTELVPALEMASNTALKAAAASGLGPVVLSRRSIADELLAGRLIQVAVDGLDLNRNFTAIWRTDRPLPTAARALLDVSCTEPGPGRS